MASDQHTGETPGAAGREPEETRRRFLDAVMSFGFVSTALSVVYPVARFLVPPAGGEPATVSAVAGKVAQLPPNSGAIFKFGSKPGIIVRDQAGEFHAFSAICTHLGCTVQYRPSNADIWCACHNAVYDLAGNVVSGPPPRPLDRLTVNVRGDEVVVTRG